VSQKKLRHFYFQHNFAICWDIFTIFDAPCSGLISAWYILLHSHHRCEASTWCDVKRDICQAVARRAYWCRISYHLLMASEFTGLKSCWLFFLEYHARESVPDMHSEYWRVETSASSGVGGAAAIGQWRRRLNAGESCVKAQGGYFDQHLRWIYM